ncbi:MAG: hypothetical protein CSB28_02495 [Desulfobacterales bacterium]|nr:MAG: hypothetical protein CSB28_02495 [Desulfobacterales bacterium]
MYVSIKPKFVKIKMETVLFVAAILLGVFSIAILPILNAFPFDYKQIGTDKTGVMLFRFLLIYLSIGIPFFLGGMILSWIFTTFS